MVGAKSETLLTGFKQKAFTEFQQKLFNMINDGRFEVRLGISGVFIESKKFQNQRFLQQVFGVADNLACVSQLADAHFVTAEGKTFIESRVVLAFEFAKCPGLTRGLDFVKAAFFDVLDAQEYDIV